MPVRASSWVSVPQLILSGVSPIVILSGFCLKILGEGERQLLPSFFPLDLELKGQSKQELSKATLPGNRKAIFSIKEREDEVTCREKNRCKRMETARLLLASSGALGASHALRQHPSHELCCLSTLSVN